MIFIILGYISYRYLILITLIFTEKTLITTEVDSIIHFSEMHKNNVPETETS